jgi:hypothetical protein
VGCGAAQWSRATCTRYVSTQSCCISFAYRCLLLLFAFPTFSARHYCGGGGCLQATRNSAVPHRGMSIAGGQRPSSWRGVCRLSQAVLRARCVHWLPAHQRARETVKLLLPQFAVMSVLLPQIRHRPTIYQRNSLPRKCEAEDSVFKLLASAMMASITSACTCSPPPNCIRANAPPLR